MLAQLVTFKPDGSRKDFTIKPDRRYKIGRQDGCDLRIPLSAVSREHAEIYFDDEEDELVIEDLKSRNGTYVNGDRVERVELCPGDVITIGPVPFQVVIDGHPADVKPIKATAPAPDNGDYRADASSGDEDDDDATTEGTVKPSRAAVSKSDPNIDSFFGFDLDEEDI